MSDSHGDMGNLLPHELDPRADLCRAHPKVPFSMMTGIDAGFSMAAFIGYHAGAGTPAAILDHTYTGFMADVRVNGDVVERDPSERGARGHVRRAGRPRGRRSRVLRTGRARCLPWVHTVAVKQGFGNRVGRTVSPERARTLVRDGVAAAVRGIDDLEPFTPAGPFTLEIDVISTVVADICALRPGTERSGPRTLRFVDRGLPDRLPMPPHVDEARPDGGARVPDRLTPP